MVSLTGLKEACLGQPITSLKNTSILKSISHEEVLSFILFLGYCNKEGKINVEEVYLMHLHCANIKS